MKLSPSITLVPFLHGKIAFTEQVRTLCANERFDCIAVDMPEPFQDDIGAAIEALPFIRAITARDVSGNGCYYVPIDPCDASIEGIRQSFQHHIPFFCIGDPTLIKPRSLPPLPDEYALEKIGFDIFSALCLKAVGNPEPGSDEDRTGRHIAARLRKLSKTHHAICAFVHFRHYVRTVFHFGKKTGFSPAVPPSYQMATYTVNPDHLYFALGELPFITGKFEKNRYDPFAGKLDTIEEIKNLFRETRDNYYDDPEQAAELSPVRIQAALTFLRNLTVIGGAFLPSLFDIVETAKGVGGNAYALRILKNARYYAYLPLEQSEKILGISIDRIAFPENREICEAVNLFRDTELYWRTIHIRPDPSLERKKKYRFAWNPIGMCSHTPEDEKIERFNAHVRAKTLKVLLEEFAHTEKFSTSVKDGIDIRETMRNWFSGDIYVREVPPSRGKIDSVVIIFDDRHDERYPHQATWFAEHQEESTLTFYATDPFSDMIGPGIAQCRYGGLSLLFPPRSIPSIFEITSREEFPNCAVQLTYGTMLFSQEKTIAYVAERKPGVTLKQLAAKLKKHLVWIPIASFSSETIRRLKKFHILNGKEVRSWAGRFIGEE